jgi:hypothetical protein
MKITIGIRIYPHTSLQKTAIKEGLITADDNLLIPKFYIAKGVEGWLRETVKAWMETRPHGVIHNLKNTLTLLPQCNTFPNQQKLGLMEN